MGTKSKKLEETELRIFTALMRKKRIELSCTTGKDPNASGYIFGKIPQGMMIQKIYKNSKKLILVNLFDGEKNFLKLAGISMWTAIQKTNTGNQTLWESPKSMEICWDFFQAAWKAVADHKEKTRKPAVEEFGLEKVAD